MTTKGLGSPIEMWWTARRSRGLLAAVHLPFLIVAPLVTALGYDGPAGPAWLVILLAVSIGAIQLRHSFATARGGNRGRGPRPFSFSPCSSTFRSRGSASIGLECSGCSWRPSSCY